MAGPDSMSAVVGGGGEVRDDWVDCVVDGESRVHSRFLFLMNGLGMRSGLGGRFLVILYRSWCSFQK